MIMKCVKGYEVKILEGKEGGLYIPGGIFIGTVDETGVPYCQASFGYESIEAAQADLDRGTVTFIRNSRCKDINRCF